jgi:hypothetical protein
MKTLSFPVRCALAALLLSVSGGFGQGSLTPPGPPGPTMKTLDQVEPRTPIDTLPIAITQSGSYYLTRSFAQNFTIADAIFIQADNVTLDLSGFTIQQTATTAAITGIKIMSSSANTPVRNTVIRNGTITGFAGSGIFAFAGRNCLLENLNVTRCAAGITFQGFGTAGAAGNTFRRCRMTDNGTGSGIVLLSGAGNVGNTIEHCESLNNGTGFAIAAAGNLIIGCRASGNTSNYTIAAGNRGGIIVLPGTNAQINGSSGGVGTGTSDSFANLSF